jgi:hypothetical protein
LAVIGSDACGTAYGLLEISRSTGVSPWEWWADVTPEKRDICLLPEINVTVQSPSVQYRGIFLNDEDWGLLPWSAKNFEPDAKTKFPVEKRFKGQIGPKTYSKIFELLLRLHANTIWPAMHEVTMPFYFVEGNREAAEKYGITVGTSHCEPLMRNSATEWDLTGAGDYNYLTNKDNVLNYWKERLQELGHSENIFTVGMRGKHDGKMQGVRTTEEYKNALTQVIPDQTELLEKYIGTRRGAQSYVSAIPQQFIPYKEVLDVYNAGLDVPDYVTLVWCDDNHGYIRHFPDEKEQARSGGNGIYYHTSYWGVPHDNLWLGIVQPALMYQQMKLACERNVRKIWILNVSDIKPSEYLTELFLDMAWNIHSITNDKLRITNSSSHLEKWLQREFGENAGNQLLPVMQEFYLLSHIRKPEFLGNTRVYEKERDKIMDLPWSEKEISDRLLRFREISDKVEAIETHIPGNRKNAYFQLIKYPVQASAQMNNKLLLAQLARHLAENTGLWKEVENAFDSIVSLTETYNSQNDGKWKYIMDFQPRKLTVYEQVKPEINGKDTQTCIFADSEIPLKKLNGTDFSSISGRYTITEGLGYEGKAIYLGKDCSAEYLFEGFSSDETDSMKVVVCLVPTHAVKGKSLRFSVSLAGSEPQVFDYETAEFSPEWKENVLRSQAIRFAVFPIPENGDRKLKICAIDEGIVIDQIFLYSTD